MTPAGRDVIIKPSSRAGLVFVVAWIMFLCLVTATGAARQHDAGALLLVFVWLPWLVPVALIARSQLTAVGDTLTYRSPLRTRAWHRTEICSFEIAPLRWSPSKGQVLVMQTIAGEWVEFLIITASGPRHAARMQHWLSALEDWRLSASQPQPK
jgi:hypothetical protein